MRSQSLVNAIYNAVPGKQAFARATWLLKNKERKQHKLMPLGGQRVEQVVH